MMLKGMNLFCVILLPLLIGCPYIDHGTTFAPDYVVTSIDEIRGCFYRESFNRSNVLVCEEMCVDSMVQYLLRKYEVNNDGKYTILNCDTSFISNVELRRPLNDGSYNYEIFIKGVGTFNYYSNLALRKLVDQRNSNEDKVYTTQGWSQCVH